MPIELSADPVPLAYDDHGTLRVGGTRVRLDTVVTAFHLGSTAEDVVEQFPSLDLADVYAVIAFYLRHRPEVDAYLTEGEARAAELRAEIETRFDPRGIRERLTARLANRRASA